MTPENGEQNRVCHLLSAMPSDAVSLDWLAGAHREQLRLCDALEEIADSLPASVNRQKCIYAAMVLGPLMEENLRRALLISRGDWTVFLTRPLSATLIAIAVFLLVLALLPALRAKRDEVFVESEN